MGHHKGDCGGHCMSHLASGVKKLATKSDRAEQESLSPEP